MTNHPGPDFTQPFRLRDMPVGTFAPNLVPVPQYTSPVRRPIPWGTIGGGFIGLILGLAVVIPSLTLLVQVLQ